MSLSHTNIEEVCETFSLQDSWQDRYAYIIELGEGMDPFPAEWRTPINKVSGCVSQVWVVHELRGDVLKFSGDSDSHLVKGLMAVVFLYYAGRSAAEIASDTQIDSLLAKLKLGEGLTPQRSNGLRALITAMKHIASQYVASLE